MTPTSTTKKTPELTPLTLWIMTIATGLVVANIYYNQPLLSDIAYTFHINSAKAGQVAMITQMGYAAGIFFIAPLADMYKRKRLMLFAFAGVVLALVATALAPNINLLLLASF